MRGSIISFTRQGMELSRKIRECVPGISWRVFTKCSAVKWDMKDQEVFVEEPVSHWAKEQMRQRNALLFIGACGIAVRAIAPHLEGKLSDSPVLVLDEKGKYVIPILSGHMGGANELALLLSDYLGMEPVLTTSTDVNQRFAIDMFAKKNHLYLFPKKGIAIVSAKFLAGEKIRISVSKSRIKNEGKLPQGVEIVQYPPNTPVDVVITEERDYEATLTLCPKRYIIGVGCRRGKEAEALEAFLKETLENCGITMEEVRMLVSIDRKKDEIALKDWSEKYRIPFVTYPAEELQRMKGDFSSSPFVKDTVGVDNVCERAALRGCEDGGNLIMKKKARDGMTVAIAKVEWRVTFEEI